MKKLLISLFLVLMNEIVFSQTEIYDQYPPGQYFYEKGELNFLKELQRVAKENDIESCKDKNEEYLVKWIIYPDSTIKFIKDMDSVNIQKNKCAFDFTRQTFKYLDGWKPIFHENKNYAVFASYLINPYEIHHIKINDDLTWDVKKAEYPGGNTTLDIDLQRLIGPIFDKNRLSMGNEIIQMTLKISKDGYVKDINFSQPIPFNIKDEILYGLKGLKKWKPASRNGVPIEGTYYLSLRFNI